MALVPETSMRPVAVLNAGPLEGSPDGLYVYCGGDNHVVFARTLGLGVDQVIDVRVQDGVDFPAITDISAVVVTGSASMVTDRHAWAERTAAWIAAHDGQVPMLGVCFGHQLIGHALGGEVEQNPAGSEYGTVTVEATEMAAGDPLFAGLPRSFAAQAAHSQRVCRLPKGGVELARNHYGLQAARYSPTSWGVQFHPEFDRGLMQVLFRDHHDYLFGLGIDVESERKRLAETPDALTVLRNFGRLVREPARVTG